MRWISKDPVCDICITAGNDHNGGDSASNKRSGKIIPMQAQIIIGNTWKLREVEIFRCNNCKYEYTFPRYAEVLKIAETRTGRCSEWSMLFGAMLSSLEIKARIVHDFLDHCWNEAMLSPDGKWVHVDSTLTFPISSDHPHYYEESWGKKYDYVLAFSADKVEDVTQRYTQQWEAIQQRRLKNDKNNMTDFEEIYSKI